MTSTVDLKEFSRLRKLGTEIEKGYILRMYGKENYHIFYTLADMHKQLSNNAIKTSITLLVINVFLLATLFSLFFFEIVLSDKIPNSLFYIFALFYGLLLFETVSTYKISKLHLRFSSMLLASISHVRTKM